MQRLSYAIITILLFHILATPSMQACKKKLFLKKRKKIQDEFVQQLQKLEISDNLSLESTKEKQPKLTIKKKTYNVIHEIISEKKEKQSKLAILCEKTLDTTTHLLEKATSPAMAQVILSLLFSTILCNNEHSQTQTISTPLVIWAILSTLSIPVACILPCICCCIVCCKYLHLKKEYEDLILSHNIATTRFGGKNRISSWFSNWGKKRNKEFELPEVVYEEESSDSDNETYGTTSTPNSSNNTTTDSSSYGKL